MPISLRGLKTLAAFGIPIYAGKQPAVRYELTKTADNRVFIRYLPAGVPIGSSKPYLTIGTYPVSRTFTVTSRLAARSGSVPVDVGKGAVAFSSRKSPESVFVAYRGSGVQIELYDPTPVAPEVWCRRAGWQRSGKAHCGRPCPSLGPSSRTTDRYRPRTP